MTMIRLIILLFAGHALCDYPLQGDFLARGKNHMNPILGVPWFQCLFAHAVIHAGMVLLLTHSVVLALFELTLHMLIDWWKCEGALTFDQDQACHYACKVLWALLAAI